MNLMNGLIGVGIGVGIATFFVVSALFLDWTERKFGIVVALTLFAVFVGSIVGFVFGAAT